MPAPLKNPYVLDPETGCWVWQGAKSRGGYAHGRRGAKTGRVMRWYYEDAKGAIPTGLVLDHLCRNPACVNPEHLEPVTTAENTQRGATAVLNWALVREIRASGLRGAEVARRFGISEMQASRVLNHKTWKEIT